MFARKELLLAGVSVLALACGGMKSAYAACGSASGGSMTISASCTGPLTWTGGDLSLTSGVVIDNGLMGISVTGGSTVGTLTSNGATIGGVGNGAVSDAGIANSGTIGMLSITGGRVGSSLTSGSWSLITSSAILNSGVIGTLAINGAAVDGFLSGIKNTGSIAALGNGGAISGGTAGIGNDGVIGALTNSGRISGGTVTGIGIYNNAGATIGRLSNSGTISAGFWGILNDGSIATLVNDGVISASTSLTTIGAQAIENSGSIATLINNGIISGSKAAITNSGALGTITNSGVIEGNILNSSSNPLTISGAGGSAYGTLTGSGSGAGTITNSASDLVFASGNLLLNDDINMAAYTVRNTGATLRVANTRTITGNYVQTGGVLAVVAASPTSYGKLLVSNVASISNSSITISGSGLAAGETFTVISAGTLMMGSNVTAATNGFSDVLSVSGGELLVTLAAVSSSSSGASSWTQKGRVAGGGAVPVGSVLDQIAGNSSYQPMLTQLAALPIQEQYHALRQLAPSQQVPQIVASGATTLPIGTAIELRQTVLAQGEGAGRAAGSQYSMGALWGQVLGGVASQDGGINKAGYTSSSFGLLIGTDKPLSAEVVGGLAVSWLRGDVNGTADFSGSRTRFDSYQLSAYGTWRPDNGPAYLRGLLGGGYNHYDQKRAIAFLGEIAQAKYDGRQIQVKLGGGYDMPLAGGPILTPMAAIQEVRVDNDGYRESGAGVAGLPTNGRGVDAVESELGSKLSSQLTSMLGSVLVDTQLSWVHSYTNSPVTVVSSMGGTGFAVTSARPAADGARLMLGATLQRSDALSLRLEYDGDLRADYRSHTGVLRVRQEF
ncbi:autotransporter outer membrane beta-barrel domain-containing protein [Telmatospirillum siberiense]|nr:autotransporter outer membrane beta-barrel domain-containing protein [Telmatospirillum siberiense]